MILDQETSPDSWLSEFRQIEKLTEQLKYVLVLLYSLSQAGQEHFHPEILKLEKYYQNHALMRKIKYRDAVLQDYAVEYLGVDYSEDPFEYDEQLERSITTIEMQLMALLGRIIKFVKESEFKISDAT